MSKKIIIFSFLILTVIVSINNCILIKKAIAGENQLNGAIKKFWDEELVTYQFQLATWLNYPPLLSVAKDQNNQFNSQITAAINNPSFENNLFNWNSTGYVEVVQGEIFTPDGFNQIVIPNGHKMIRLGTNQNELVDSNFLNNQISQIIDNQEQKINSLGFWFYFVSQEIDPGFDDPFFLVSANQEVLFQFRLVDLIPITKPPIYADWFFECLDISHLNADQIEIIFSAGNNADDQYPSYIYLDNIQTNCAVINDQAKLTLNKNEALTDDSVSYQYWLAGQLQSQTAPSSLDFYLNQEIDQNYFEYWSEKNPHHSVAYLFYDSLSPPPITDLKIFNEAADEYSLFFTAPGDNLFYHPQTYQIKYSLMPIEESTDWSSLAEAIIINNPALNLNLGSPLLTKWQEALIINGPEENLPYYFAIRSIDYAGNLSAVSNSVKAEFLPFSQLPILINEIMFNPSGDESALMPAGEWLELYNPNNYAIDLDQYFIQDAAANQMIITPANSDNNQNYQDEGETMIPAKGFLSVFRNNTAMFNNSGDTLFLYDQEASLNDQISYQGNQHEDQTTARYPDGANDWYQACFASLGQANVCPAALIAETSAQLLNNNYLRIIIANSNTFNRADLEINYQYLEQEIILNEHILISIELNPNQATILDQIFLGSCSSDGVCQPHQNINPQSMSIKITLQGDQSYQELTIFPSISASKN